jgi:hypothetical protein
MIDEDGFVYGCNVRNQVISVCHAHLRRWSVSSEFRSFCPICQTGILLVHRDSSTFRIIRRDNCVRCGQSFVYTDDIIGGEQVWLPSS